MNYAASLTCFMLKACWRGDIAVKSFLSAPVLSELAAVEVLAAGLHERAVVFAPL